MNVHFQNRLALIALGCSLPAAIVAGWAAWHYAPTLELRIVALTLIALAWAAGGWFVRRASIAPLNTIANLIEAIRMGDYTVRGRRASNDDAIGQVTREVNALGASLHEQRLASMEAGAFVTAVLEELDTAVFAFDAAERLRLVNRAGAGLLARSPESLQGLAANELGLAGWLQLPADTTLFHTFPARGGQFEVKQRPFREGGLPHRLLILSDLSRALRDEERRAWQRLIRVVGHEVNNSLTPIKSLAETLADMLRSGQAESPEVLEALGLIGDRADSLARFVATYSQLARLPAPSRRAVDLRALAARLVGTGPFEGVVLEAPDGVVLDLDAGQIEQALINLLKNAVEAGSAPSAVTLRIDRTPALVSVAIADDGAGIANPENLFVPFFTTKPEGSGIGLALSRQIVEAHGGTLTLANRDDAAGAVATVTLPLSDARTRA